PVLDLVPRALGRDRERVERASLRAVEVEDLARVLLELAKRLSASANQDRRHPRMDLDQEGLGPGALDELAEPALDLDRDRLLGAHHALALAGRTGLVHDLPDALGDVLPGHLDQPERRDLDHMGPRAVLVERLAEH